MIITLEKLEKIFVSGGFLKPEEFKIAKEQAVAHKWGISQAIVELGYLSDVQAGSLIAGELGLFFVDLAKERIDPAVINLIPEVASRGQMAVIYKRTGEGVWLATPNAGNYEFFKLIEKALHQPVTIAYATALGVEAALKTYQKDILEQARALLKRMRTKAQDEDTVRLVRLIVTAGFENRASDIHIEPEKEEAVVRFRIDGSMHEVLRYPMSFHDKIVFRLKILSRLRTDEHAQAQDGRFEMKIGEALLNLRVSILPITHGENVVMRLLSEGFQRLRLEDLGLQEDDLEKIKRAVRQPHGMILASGPTGSGKTTTLYAIINILNKPDVNLMTIEDPVEYDIQGIRQIQVNPRTNLTFDEGLKSIVRQDPDIIMVGEIRDPQTASIAINAALTGHLLLSTLHANDAATTFPRLYEMNVEPFLVASSVNVVIAQRLVRRICSNCIESFTLGVEEKEALERDKTLHDLVQRIGGKKDISMLRFYSGRGCRICGGLGYLGRMGIFEIMEITEAIRPLIVNKATSDDLRAAAVQKGMRTMLEDGIVKVFQGKTTIMEIIRATKA